MPGLVGFTNKNGRYNKNVLAKMRGILKHFDDYFDEELYSDKKVYASRTHLGILNQGKQPYSLKNRFFTWMEGEFYNQKELESKYDMDSTTDIELLTNVYNSTRSFEFLKDIDGFFVSVLYDKKEKCVFLITDRYGLKHLYWGIINNNLVWSSEVKGFLEHIDFDPKIDDQAVSEFFNIGYILKNRTWFENLELVPPASILIFSLTNSTFKIKQYWSWYEIKPLKRPIDERELVEELGRLFKDAVRMHVNRNERIGIPLSGGLDSRAILAAVPKDYDPLHTITFGQKKCADIKIAGKVLKIRNAFHHIDAISNDNWLNSRCQGVWITDGQLALLHMHAINSIFITFRNYFEVVLNGFLGGAVLGGGYTYEDRWPLVETISNRGRRFVNEGTRLIETKVVNRNPFFNNNLMELTLSIPESLLRDKYIYKRMLLQLFPRYFNAIPYQGTGCPISCSPIIEDLNVLKNRIIAKVKRESLRVKFDMKNLRDYTNYPLWIRMEPAKSFFRKMLLSKKALYTEYIDKNIIRGYLDYHMARKANYHNELCQALTFELWLNQVFYRKYCNHST